MRNLSEYISNRFFKVITKASQVLNYESYVIGGYVRDILLERPSNDIDVVPLLAEHFCIEEVRLT